jgi:gamma-glutamyltranspeptidase/glutathione hydrolase
MIATAHPLATAAGLRVLQAGGSAVDAGIAAGLVLNVVLPMMCSPGGDVFMLGFDAVSKGVWSINSSGPAGLCATRAEYLKRGYKAMPLRGALAVSVPGQMRGFQAAWEQHGRLPWTGLFEDAIKFARRGHPVASTKRSFWRRPRRRCRPIPSWQEFT